MKKKLIIIFSSIAGAALLITAILAACANMDLGKKPQETESGTITVPSQLSPSESESDSSAEETDKENVSKNETTVDYSESSTESESADESEPNTESQPDALSLEYVSHGNGTCSVSGIGNVTDSYITIPLRSPEGDVVTSISEKAFSGNSYIRAVEIPSTVSHIGDMAFADCPELVYLSVDKDNKSFIDVGGILFTADLTRIISYPASSGASTISIPVSVTKISPMAFFGCNNLKTIEYAGSAEEWSKIEIGDLNYSLYSTSIICKDADK